MNSSYEELDVEVIELDYDNPRIAKFLEYYSQDKSEITSEAISMALGGGVNSDDNGTSYQSLKESIKANNGIIHPIIVNRKANGKLVAIEGNTRLQIYRELKQLNVPGSWNIIKSIVYDDLSDEEIHSIRLQSHLVGPREWDPYSKAKYLNHLSNEQKLPMSQVIAFCGGKQNEIIKLINAYNDMESFYRCNLQDDHEFNQKEFSKFSELQNASVKHALLANGFGIEDFAKWVIDGKIDTAQNVRKLPAVLKSNDAKQVLLKSNITEAYNKVVIEGSAGKDLGSVPYEKLADELTRKIDTMEYNEFKSLKNDPSYEAKRNSLEVLRNSLDSFLVDIEG